MKIRRTASLALAVILIFSTIFTVSFFATATSETVFRDSLNDLSKIYDYGLPTQGFYQCTSGSVVGGDQTVMIDSNGFNALKDSNGQLVFYPYFVWKVNGGAKVEFYTYLWDASQNFTLSWSADGQTFNTIPLSSVQIDEITAANETEKNLADEYGNPPSDISHRLYTISAIDSTARFFKATWPQINGSWKAAPSMFRYTGGTAAEDPAFGKTVSMANNKDTDTGAMETYSDAFDYNQKITNVPVIMVNYYYLAGKASVEKPYVVYKAADEEAFKADFLAHESFFRMNTDVKFYVSDNATSGYTEIAASRKRVPTSADANVSELSYIIPHIPAGKNYVKVEFPYDKDYTGKAWPCGTPGTIGDPLTYMISLKSVSFTEPSAEDITVVTDTTSEFTGDVNVDAKVWADYTKNVFDFSYKLENSIHFLALDYYAVYGKTSLPPIYVTYKVKSGSPFVLEGFNHVRHVHLQNKFKLFSSSDGVTFTELSNVIYTVKPRETSPGFYDESFLVQAIPDNHKFVRVVWPNAKDYTGTVDTIDNQTIGDPVQYAPGLVRVKYNKSDSATDENELTEVAFNGNESVDAGNWVSYSKNIFDFSQKFLGTTPFLVLNYEKVLGKTTLPEIYVIYKVKDGSPFILKGLAHDRSVHLGLKFKLYSSADMSSWQEIPNVSYSKATNQNGFSNEEYSVTGIPAGHTYVKVVWPNQKDYTGTVDPVNNDTIGDPLNYSPGLVSATFIKGTVTEEPVDNNDPVNITGDTTVIITGDESTDSKKMVSYNKDAIDFTQMMQVGENNLPVLMLKSDFVDGKTSLPEAYVTYRVAENSPIKVVGYNHPNAVALGLKFKLYGSSDGKNFTELTDILFKSEEITGSNWTKETYGLKSLPAGMTYLKVVWPNQKDYTGTVNPTDGQMIDSLCYAPALQSLTFNVSAGFANTGDNTVPAAILLIITALAALFFLFVRSRKVKE